MTFYKTDVVHNHKFVLKEENKANERADLYNVSKTL